jgi:hypothetical protein
MTGRPIGDRSGTWAERRRWRVALTEGRRYAPTAATGNMG